MFILFSYSYLSRRSKKTCICEETLDSIWEPSVVETCKTYMMGVLKKRRTWYIKEAYESCMIFCWVIILYILQPAMMLSRKYSWAKQVDYAIELLWKSPDFFSNWCYVFLNLRQGKYILETRDDDACFMIDAKRFEYSVATGYGTK